MKPVSRIVWLGALVVLFCLGTSPAGAADAAYVGTDTCSGCHEKLAAGFEKSFHGQAWASIQKYQASGCEACHGPGSKHADSNAKADIISFGRKSAQTPAARSATCQQCHATNQDLAFWDNGKHAANGVACADCHDTHASAVPKVNQPDVCFACHKDVRLDANKQSHHPIVEGKVSCSDCHNPHGSLTRGMLRADTKNQLCYTCHAEKRGPFVWEHPPVEENCGTCHEPHGSRHNKLTTEKIPSLCQNCHDWSQHPGTPYDNRYDFNATGGNLGSTNKLVARSCLNCHSSIHGSNAPGNAGRRFTR
jgi:DmsE family decaheme c-type cytochrome